MLGWVGSARERKGARHSLRRGCEAGLREERMLVRVRMVRAGRVEEASHNKISSLVVLGMDWISGG